MRWSVIVSAVGCLVFLALGVVGRKVILFNVSGNHEIVEILFAWGTFLGAAALWREGALLQVGVVGLILPRAAAWCLDVAIQAGMLGFAVLLIVYGWDLATAIQEFTPFLQAPKFYWYLSLPVSGAIMVVYSVVALWDLVRHPFAGRRAIGKQQELI